jgi:hypothetical protein
MSAPLNFSSKCIFPQIDNIVSLKDVEYMSIGKVLFDIKKYVSIMAHGYDTNDTLIYFYNFNGFLSILDKLIFEEGFNNDFKTLLLFPVANFILVVPNPKFEPAPPSYDNNTSFPGAFKLYPLT